jgi:hypothetical protein
MKYRWKMEDNFRIRETTKICHVDNSGYIAYIIAIRKCQGPGGPPGLQNQCTGDELVGGFDSHALPPYFIEIISLYPS